MIALIIPQISKPPFLSAASSQKIISLPPTPIPAFRRLQPYPFIRSWVKLEICRQGPYCQGRTVPSRNTLPPLLLPSLSVLSPPPDILWHKQSCLLCFAAWPTSCSLDKLPGSRSCLSSASSQSRITRASWALHGRNWSCSLPSQFIASRSLGSWLMSRPSTRRLMKSYTGESCWLRRTSWATKASSSVRQGYIVSKGEH